VAEAPPREFKKVFFPLEVEPQTGEYPPTILFSKLRNESGDVFPDFPASACRVEDGGERFIAVLRGFKRYL